MTIRDRASATEFDVPLNVKVHYKRRGSEHE